MSTDTVLITGASSDLGTDLVRSLMKRPNPPRVLAHFYRSRDRVEELRGTFSGSIVPIQADLSVASDVAHLIEQVRLEASFPTKIVHFAALAPRLERFPSADLSHFECDLAVQLLAIVHILRQFLPAMSESETVTKVVFVLSSYTLGASPKYTSFYTTVKYAQLGFMRALVSDYAGTRVNINAVSPSMVETRFLSNIPAKAVEITASQNPHRRNTKPIEVTNVIEFLLSPESDSLNGVNIPVTGGAAY
jgi:3-oxoacyl-[acyl-carrier protein] reductase